MLAAFPRMDNVIVHALPPPVTPFACLPETQDVACNAQHQNMRPPNHHFISAQSKIIPRMISTIPATLRG
jgi:hypothetical protein